MENTSVQEMPPKLKQRSCSGICQVLPSEWLVLGAKRTTGVKLLSWQHSDFLFMSPSCPYILPNQPFDHVSEAEITLRNTGKVGFKYAVIDAIQSSADNPPPGVPLTLPVSVSTSASCGKEGQASPRDWKH